MTRPTKGGRWLRDPVTGTLTPALASDAAATAPPELRPADPPPELASEAKAAPDSAEIKVAPKPRRKPQ